MSSRICKYVREQITKSSLPNEMMRTPSLHVSKTIKASNISPEHSINHDSFRDSASIRRHREHIRQEAVKMIIRLPMSHQPSMSVNSTTYVPDSPMTPLP